MASAPSGEGVEVAPKRSRVLVAARSVIRQAGLEKLIAGISGFRVAGVCAGLATLEERARQLAPDLIVVDWDESASEFGDVLERLAEQSCVLVLADDPSPGLTAELLAGGVHSVIPRDSNPAEFSAALTAAEEGLVVLDAETAQELALRLPHLDSSEPESEELTERESEILELLAEGIGNKKIAQRLGISEHTAKFHISSILGKLSVSNRTEAVARAIRQGLIVL